MKTNIMLVTNNIFLFSNTINELDRSDIEIIIAESTEDAIEKFQQGGTDLVILDNTIDVTEKRKLTKILSLLNNDVILAETVEGEGINHTIKKITQQNLQNNYSLIDDALLNAKLNIKVEE